MKRSLKYAAGVLMLTPLATDAQTISPRQPTIRTSNVPGENMCLRLSSMPTNLSGSNEGMLLIRMQAEIDAVTERALRAEGRSDSTAMRKIYFVKSRLDSVSRMINGSMDSNADQIQMFGMRPSMQITGMPVTVEGKRTIENEAQRMLVTSTLRELQPQVAEISRGGPPQMTIDIRLNTLGYVGLSTSAGTFPTSIDPMRPFAYCDYPRVESVEAGSPAEKAGILAGDTLVAYNNHDLRQYNVNYPDLLVPGKPLAVRYRRDGRALNTSMIVAARDMTSMSACTEAEAAAGCRSERVTFRSVTVPGSPTGPGGGVVATVQGGARVSAGPMPARAQGTTFMMGTPRGVMITSDGAVRFEGASIRAIDEQTAESLGIEAGLVVLEAADNQSAFVAGLRKGDKIVSVNGNPVRDIPSFMRSYSAKAPERQVVLQVTNKTAGARTITIRW